MIPQEIEQEVLDKIELLTALIIPHEESRLYELAYELVMMALIKCYCDVVIMQDKAIFAFLKSEAILIWITGVHGRSVEETDRIAQAYAVRCLQTFIQNDGIEMPLTHTETPSRYTC